MNISELYNIATVERKYLNREERMVFFKATAFMKVDIKFYCRIDQNGASLGAQSRTKSLK